ncbi:hypothetical protein GGR26_002657 [Lewinella marina]|uniref:DUF4249 domain-containing protein n=1 Tax=Neolewinella marina TaxID=438751 RepID=A0A2G0CD67_9BACT|nr:DUF4249 family protein [Neolewinella marina]NJB86880.1 hypothetical protein [Neolewinella marina]PHK97921.1 hypothetical protein CGL56_13995 [Neolewinella marina]
MMRTATLLFLALLGFGCTDVIDLETNFQDPQLVVDAWLTNEPVPQEIRLSLSQDYYDNRLPPGLTNAEVVVCRTAPDNRCFTFFHQDSGRYVWTPGPADSLGAVGAEFVLAIQLEDATYGSQATIRRVPEIDSLVVRYEENQLGFEDGRYAQLYARDFPGTGDVYLTRSYLNDTLLNRPFELNLIYDGTFDAGSRTDGLVFIAPIRQNVNPRDDGGAFVPLQPGDTLRVDLWSLAPEAYFFLGVARDQLQNGANGIFQIPVANAPGNIYNLATEESALGMFNIAGVSTAVRVVEE